MKSEYIHGYSADEQTRLLAQNEVLAEHIYSGWDFSDRSALVEIGCGVGAQLIYLAEHYPHLALTGVDISLEQILTASKNIRTQGYSDKIKVLHDANGAAAIPDESADVVLMVWVLEHVNNPAALLAEAYRILKPGGMFCSAEVIQNNFQIYPNKPAIQKFWLQTLLAQVISGGNPYIGVRMGNLLFDAGFEQVKRTLVPLISDKTDPADRQVMLQYWLDLMKSAYEVTAMKGFVSPEDWDACQSEMHELMKDPDAVSFHGFVRSSGIKAVQ